MEDAIYFSSGTIYKSNKVDQLPARLNYRDKMHYTCWKLIIK